MVVHGPTRLTVPVSQRDHVRGPATAPVTLVEYGDYECPHCGQAFPVVEAVRRQLGNTLRFAYRHFPLTEIHPHALPAAEAAEAAGAEGRFWEMHETLFEHQDALDGAHLIGYAAAVGLAAPAFARVLAEHTFADRVRADVLGGLESGVAGTPTFFINDVRYEDSYDYESLLAALETAAELSQR